MRQECITLLEKLKTTIASCTYPHLLPESAKKAHQSGCQILTSVQSALGQQLMAEQPDEKQVYYMYKIILCSVLHLWMSVMDILCV